MDCLGGAVEQVVEVEVARDEPSTAGDDSETIGTSFPSFVELLQGLGGTFADGAAAA